MTFPANRKDAVVTRDSAALPATTTAPIFRVTGGRIRLKSLIGEVTTAIQAQACNLKAKTTPTVGSVVDLCGYVDVNGLPVGTQLTITGTAANPMVATNGASAAQVGSFLVKEGTIDLTTSATNTGAVKWTLTYDPLDMGATVSVA